MRNHVGISFGIQLSIAVILGHVAAAACLILSAFGLGGWGVALAVWHLINAQAGFGQIKRMNYESRPLNNGEAGLAFTVAVQFGVGVILAFDPPKYSAWWALLMPLWIAPFFAITLAAGAVLNVINPAGRT